MVIQHSNNQMGHDYISAQMFEKRFAGPFCHSKLFRVDNLLNQNGKKLLLKLLFINITDVNDSYYCANLWSITFSIY